MTEENTMTFKKEGQNAFPAETEKDNSADSSTEETKDNTQSSEGDNTQDENDNVPFHKHPRWTKREEEWKGRFNEMESRHQEELKNIREEFGSKKSESSIPSWFGGDEEQWKAYQEYMDKSVLSKAEERAMDRISKLKIEDEKKVKEATDYMHSEIANIKEDKSLNPKGDDIDANKLLKFVLDNDLVDSKGRWNYRAGWKLMQSQNKAPVTKKGLASATTSEAKAESKNTAFKTADDFKFKKPW